MGHSAAVYSVGKPTAKYPYEAVQTFSNRERSPIPFKLDRAFAKAFAASCRQYGIEKLKLSARTQPPQILLRLILNAL